jgi:hypothetical protein
MTAPAAAYEEEPTRSHELRVPLFQSIFKQLDPERRYVVLDLGPARSGMIKMLVDQRCRIDVVALPDQLSRLRSLEEHDEIEQIIRASLPPACGESVDFVLAWNLLNYMDAKRMQALTQALKPRLAPGACLHALIEYSSRQMPAAPGMMTPRDDGNLLVEPDESDGLIDTPRYARARLEAALPGLSADHTMLLGNGMQEYLFKRIRE